MRDDRELCPAWCVSKWHVDVAQCSKQCKTYKLVMEELQENGSSRLREGVVSFGDKQQYYGNQLKS
jgi:hypothetical protein